MSGETIIISPFKFQGTKGTNPLLLQAFYRTRFRKWTTEIGSWQ